MEIFFKMIWFLYALLSAIFLSLSEIFQKRGLFKEHALEFNVAKYTFSLILLLFLVPFIDFRLSLFAWAIIIISTVLGTVGNLYRSKAYRHMQISSVAPLFNLSPLFVAILAFFILGESLQGSQLIGIFILIVGAYVLEVDHNVHHLAEPIRKLLRSKYNFYIFFVLILFGFSSILTKMVIEDYNVTPLQLLFLCTFFMTVQYYIHSLFVYGIKGIKESFRAAKIDAFFSGLFWVIEIYFMFMSLSLQMVSLVIPVKRLNTLFTTLGGGTIFKDKGLYLKGIGCIILFIGAYFVAR